MARLGLRHGWLMLALVAPACSSTQLAEAHLDAVLPSRAAEGVATPIVVSGQGLFPQVTTDFVHRRSSSLAAQVEVALVAGDGTVSELEQPAYVGPGSVSAVVPATQPRGLYDVRVRDGRGAEAVLPSGFSVVTPAESVARFEFQPFGDQVAGVPFPVVLVALDEAGTLVESFTGSISLSDGTGTVDPPQAGPFARGKLQLFVSVSALTAGDQLDAVDPLGHSGTSDAFAVTAGQPSALTFTTAPTVTTAGACAGPFLLQLVDAHGFAAAVAQDTVVTLAAPPLGGVTFAADAACATPEVSATVSAGTGAVALWLRATIAGNVSILATPAGLPSAAVPLEVQAGPPVRLSFTMGPAAVGKGVCSTLIQLTSQDSLGNPSPPTMSTPIALSATPAAGVSLFADAQCGTALSTVQLDAATDTISLWLNSTVTGTLRLDADTVGGAMLPTASLVLEVTP